MSRRVVFICGGLSGSLPLELLARLIKERSGDETEAMLMQLEEPIPPPVFQLSACPGDVPIEEAVILREDHSGHSLRSQRRQPSARVDLKLTFTRSRRTQSITRRGKHRN